MNAKQAQQAGSELLRRGAEMRDAGIAGWQDVMKTSSEFWKLSEELEEVEEYEARLKNLKARARQWFSDPEFLD